MKVYKKIVLIIIAVLAFGAISYQIVSAVSYIQWHNAGHPPVINGKIAQEVDGYFVGEATDGNTRIYVEKDFCNLGAESYCTICQRKESLLYKVATFLKIIKEQPQKQRVSNIFQSDYGITVN